jgi:crotonobetainyl-CoA:carnitine CoA-transferase CaiB-like acyl-CoA transferase
MSLKGVRVLEVGSYITCPLACSMLSDLGAEVIKVERPGTGDPFRAQSADFYSVSFKAMNWSKRSLTLDLTKPEALPIFNKIVGACDVLVENFRPGTMDKLGIGYEALRAVNPRLIYCSITGFSHGGPYKMRPSFDVVAQGMSGHLSLLMDLADDPWVPNQAIADQITAIYASYGILAALLERERTGVARRVDATMLDSMISLNSLAFMAYAESGQLLEREGRAPSSQSYVLVCQDKKALVLHMSTPEHFWRNLLKAIGAPQLGEDPRFSSWSGRRKNYKMLKGELAAIFGTRPRDEWLPLLDSADVPHSAANTVDEVTIDPQVKYLDTISTVSHPVMGPVTRIRRPVYLDGKRDENVTAPPMVGEHTDEVLAEFGLGSGEIDELRLARIV